MSGLQERLDDDTERMPVRQVSDRRPSVEQSMVYQASWTKSGERWRRCRTSSGRRC